MGQILWAHRLGENSANRKEIFLCCIGVGKRSKKELAFYNQFLLGDDLTQKGKQDDIRINIRQSWERQYWSKKFGITQKRLKELVEVEGPLVSKVQSALEG